MYLHVSGFVQVPSPTPTPPTPSNPEGLKEGCGEVSYSGMGRAVAA